mmetsp:Transcript_26947/g.41063  ORF Transcript_26947/g.41063 Transcript_26947/m.41063 type:complete len:114 (+) Transcript_26947:1804-2145(+)
MLVILQKLPLIRPLGPSSDVPTLDAGRPRFASAPCTLRALAPFINYCHSWLFFVASGAPSGWDTLTVACWAHVVYTLETNSIVSRDTAVLILELLEVAFFKTQEVTHLLFGSS